MAESLTASAATAFWEFCCDRTVDLLDIVLHIELDQVPGADAPGARPQRKPKGPRLSYSQFQLLSHYEVLDVPIHAEEEDLKRAYRQKALEHHPDKNLDDPDAAKKFLRVKEAFETLKDPVLHAEYDYQRGKQQDIPRTAPTPARTPQGNEPTSLLGILGRFRNFVLYGGFLSGLTGPPLPPGIARLSPAQYIHQYPPPFKSTGISIDDLASFITSFPDVRLTMKPGPLNFFKVVGGFFDCIEYDELQHDRHTARAPIFGNELNRWCSRDNRPYSLDGYTIVPLRPPYAADFYEHWVQFETKKDFSWMAFHGYAPQDLVYAAVRE
ncbi:hypothetical protein D9611_013009 [Ephemerocybe angulata]|uniref:J domain-containing protein n=1 Tax=Ephemerocybe angulata TaxID=980116 RepID=A0A8H5AW18_9AGAR|nr:hypothetical protein D9611_013009 [Tulosesus angulatus]